MPENQVEFELNVTSGQVAYADWLPGFDIFGDFLGDINAWTVRCKSSIAFAKVGCARGWIGNSCPSLYRVGEDSYVIANFRGQAIPKNYIYIKQIVTDAMWYSFADAEEFVRRDAVDDPKNYDHFQTRPGVYKFIHHTPPINKGRVDVYATFSWVREPDPIVDFQRILMEVNFTAGQVIQNKLNRSSDYYSSSDKIQRAANDIFICYGTGAGFHPNGFIQFDAEMQSGTPDLEVPEFSELLHWSPLSQFSPLTFAAKGHIALNESFADLAKNIARCIAIYGSRDHPENQKLAAELLKQLEERYP